MRLGSGSSRWSLPSCPGILLESPSKSMFDTSWGHLNSILDWESLVWVGFSGRFSARPGPLLWPQPLEVSVGKAWGDVSVRGDVSRDPCLRVRHVETCKPLQAVTLDFQRPTWAPGDGGSFHASPGAGVGGWSRRSRVPLSAPSSPAVVLGDALGLLGGRVQPLPLLLRETCDGRAHLQRCSHPGIGLLKMLRAFC